MTSREVAKNTVIDIAKEWGYIRPSTMDSIGQMDPEFRREIEECKANMGKNLAHGIKTLAKNLYSSDARFVFELVQNADDNQFTHATGRDELPFIAFKVHPDRIVFECNEDGFTKENLSAICSVGKSTKAASHRYIGAKGIGFKSVFMAAWKVDIQSGDYTFYFKHEKGDLGLGMVLPIWDDTVEASPDSLTRTTLHLHQNGEAEEIRHLHQTIFKQLNDLEPTCLLFLKNLKEIRVSFYDGDGELKSSKISSLDDNPPSKVFLKTESIDENGKKSVERKGYYTTCYMATGLPRSDNRELPDTDEAKRVSAEAEIVLAFPLTADNKPLLETQSVFAFLPVRKTNFKFLIQSDFDTNGSREDVSSSSRRNTELRDHVASAFVDAITKFTFNSDLCYTWPMYLPSQDDAPGTFWADLHSKIAERLATQSVLMSRHGSRKKIKKVVVLTRDYMDSDGNPLLDDSGIDPFLSSHYPYESWAALRAYGLKITSSSLILRMIRKDLESATSRIKSKSTSEDIHARIAKLLSRYAEEEDTKPLVSLDLLPLRSGHWFSANSGSVFFPTTNGISIPPGLELRILDPIAVANESRRSLFLLLGATEASAAQVRDLILKKFCSFIAHPAVDESRAQLHFLYLTHQSNRDRDELKNVIIYCHYGFLIGPHQNDCYLPSDHPYGPEALLKAADNLPGIKVPFVHPVYLENVPETPSAGYPSWNKWLQDTIGVRTKLRLIAQDGKRLSDAWDYVAKFRPEKLLGLLQHLWSSEGRAVIRNHHLKQAIRETDANRLCGIEPPGKCQLDQTYLPLPNLLQQRSRFLKPNEKFPFLELEGTLSEEQLISKWIFLHTNFCVKKDENIEFFLDILKWLKEANPIASSIEDYERISTLYGAINAKYLGAGSKLDTKSCIKSFFVSGHYIFVPKRDQVDGDSATWAGPKECLWEGPPHMITKFPLQHVYGEFVPKDQLSHLSNFFKQALDITAASWSDLTNELAARRDEGCQDFAPIFDLYKYLHGMKAFAFVDNMRHAFEINPLIFVTRNSQTGWYKTSECLWSSATEIRGMVTLNDHYEDLRDFFIGTLGVKTLTLQIVYDDLLETSEQATIEETKAKIWSLNALFHTENDYVDPKPLSKCPIFPVVYPDGTNALRSAATQFVIPDREHLASRFRGKIKILDFSQEEVRHLKAFFEWANLSHLYISAAVKELTSLSGETTRLSPSPNRDLRRKAHAILRIASTFNSLRYRTDPLELYNLLRTASIEETDGILSILRISQDGKVADVEESVGKLHVSEESSRLTIYVPRDKKAQELCFVDLLPRQLVDWLMRDPITQISDKVETEAVDVMTKILHTHPSATDLVLERLGVKEVDIQKDGSDVDDETPSEGSESPDTATSEDLTQSRNVVTPPSSQNALSPRDSPEQVLIRQTQMVFRSPSPSQSRPIPMFSPHGYSSEDSMQYRRLLDHVLLYARRATLPSNGAFNMRRLSEALPGEGGRRQFDGFDGLEVRDGFRSDSQLERDRKIGAAGELYVFEFLSSLSPSLPDWSDRNWQSTIRKYVTIHPDYANMEPWYGRETADIIYDDRAGNFTALLIVYGYLDANEWRGKRPKYFIEVKTTTGPRGTPFYMSKHQYERMRIVHNSDGRSEVYLIFRVFDIRGNNLGMSVYFDPEQLRLDGELVFTGETWSVVPG